MARMMKKGVTRICFCFMGYAFKVPNWKGSHYHFIMGMANNWAERMITKQKTYELTNKGHLYNPTIFSLIFGLMSIQEEVEILSEEEFFLKESPITGDVKPENFGRNKKGRIVCVDYA